MASDWTVPQRAADYSDEDQAVWRLLVERQTALAKAHACDEFVQGLETLGIGDSIPDFAAVNARLEKLTGWRVVGVPGLDPRRGVLRSPGPSAISGDGVDPHPRRARLSGRARPVPRFLRPRAAAQQSGVRRLHADVRPARHGSRRQDRPAGAPLLVHGRVRPDPHRRRASRSTAPASCPPPPK